MKLSIAVITMNRAEQLREALQSCVNCILPNETEFVIVDNASTDNTKKIVELFFRNNPYSYIYEYEEENLGVGGGRNRAFELCNGEYAYFLDDDAVIAPDSYKNFFVESLSLFEKDLMVATITTKIYDELLGKNREVICSKKTTTDGIPNIFMYLGGSHFLRKKCFSSPLYLNIKYGMEELVPSIYSHEKRWRNCYLNNIRILHQPKVNKWAKDNNQSYEINKSYNINQLCSKSILYPKSVMPLLLLTFFFRNCKRFGFNAQTHIDVYRTYKMHAKTYKLNLKKISFSTLYRLRKEYSYGTIF